MHSTLSVIRNTLEENRKIVWSPFCWKHGYIGSEFHPKSVGIRRCLLTLVPWWGIRSTGGHCFHLENSTLPPPPKKNNSSATPKWSQRNQLAEKLRHPTLKSQVHDLQAWITFSGPRSRYQTHAGPGSVFTLTYLGNGNFRFLPLSKVPGINTCACCWVTGQQKPPEGNQIWEEEGQLQNNTFLLKDPNGIANWCYHSTGLRLSEFISLRSFQ